MAMATTSWPSAVVDQGIEQNALAEETVPPTCSRKNGIDRQQVRAVVATGYGRKLISVADRTITEITCQAWGVRQCMPQARTIIDIGGQDSKVVRLQANGTVADFVMNDRCAAGTGRFLELLATRLGVRLAALADLAGRSRTPALISSMCVVFAENRDRRPLGLRRGAQKTLWPASRPHWQRASCGHDRPQRDCSGCAHRRSGARAPAWKRP